MGANQPELNQLNSLSRGCKLGNLASQCPKVMLLNYNNSNALENTHAIIFFLKDGL